MCRSARNARAEATVGRIVSGLTEHYATKWGAGSRKVEIRAFPGMAMRSSFVVGPGTAFDIEVRRVWRELGDGAYLMTMIDGEHRQSVAVQVEGDEVDIEPLSPEDLALLPGLAQAFAEEETDGQHVRS